MNGCAREGAYASRPLPSLDSAVSAPTDAAEAALRAGGLVEAAGGDTAPPEPVGVEAGGDEAARGPISVEAVDDAARDEWDAFVSRSADRTLYHRYRWRGVIADVFGHESLYLLARDGSGRACGVLPLVRLESWLFGDFMVSMPYFNYGGLLAASPAARGALLDEAVRRAAALGVGHVELRHRAGLVVDLPARDDKVAMWLDLPDSEEALWKGFKSKLRSQIRRPEKDGAVLRQGGAELVDDFYAVFARNMRDLGTPVYPRRFFSSIVAAFADEAKVFVVDLAGKPVAAGLVLADGATMEVPWASSLRDANSAGINMLLYWAMLRDAVNRGFRRFDFGRSTRDSGTFRFKLQWGARPQPLLWHYWLPAGKPLPRLTPSNPKYRTAIALWRKLPVPVANLLGPRIVKHLP